MSKASCGEAHARLGGREAGVASGRSQNWLPDYVKKANDGGIERVLV